MTGIDVLDMIPDVDPAELGPFADLDIDGVERELIALADRRADADRRAVHSWAAHLGAERRSGRDRRAAR